MKLKVLPLACVAALFTAGCDSKDKSPGDPQVHTNTPDENWNNPPATTNPPPTTAPQTKAQSYPPSASLGGTEVLEIEDMKQDYLVTITERLRELDEKAVALNREAQNSKDEITKEADLALTDLRRQQKNVANQFEQLKAASEASWNEVKTAFEASLKDWEKSYDDAKAKLNHAGS